MSLLFQLVFCFQCWGISVLPTRSMIMSQPISEATLSTNRIVLYAYLIVCPWHWTVVQTATLRYIPVCGHSNHCLIHMWCGYLSICQSYKLRFVVGGYSLMDGVCFACWTAITSVPHAQFACKYFESVSRNHFVTSGFASRVTGHAWRKQCLSCFPFPTFVTSPYGSVQHVFNELHFTRQIRLTGFNNVYFGLARRITHLVLCWNTLVCSRWPSV